MCDYRTNRSLGCHSPIIFRGIMKNYFYLNEFGDYILHDADIHYDYIMSEFDIIRNIDIQKSLTCVARYFNAMLDENENVILEEI